MKEGIEMFILKGKDFEIKMENLKFTYFYEDEDFETVCLDSSNDGLEQLIDITTLCDYSETSLLVNGKDFDFSFEYSVEYNENINDFEYTVVVTSEGLKKEEIERDYFFNAAKNTEVVEEIINNKKDDTIQSDTDKKVENLVSQINKTGNLQLRYEGLPLVEIRDYKLLIRKNLYSMKVVDIDKFIEYLISIKDNIMSMDEYNSNGQKEEWKALYRYSINNKRD